MNAKESNTLLEAQKLAYDLYKHLITLNTGSIVILASFLSNIFQQPEWKWAIVISMCSFVLSIIACLIMLLVLVADVSAEGKAGYSPFGNFVGSIGTILAWGGFLSGLVSLTAFVIKNLY